MSLPEHLSRRQLFAYSLPALAMSALQIPLQYFLPAFYSSHVGLSLSVVGLIFLLTRFWDVITDPVLGVVCDRFPSRFGRRRHWLVISVPFLVVGGYMLFMPPAGAGAAHLLGWLLLIYVGWTILMVSYFAWGAELATDYNERTRVNGTRDTMGLFGVVLLMAIPAVLERFAGLDSVQRVHTMGWILIVTLPLTIWAAVALVPERKNVAPVYKAMPSLRILLRNRVLGRLLVADILTGIGITSTAVMFVFFADHALKAAAYTSTALAIYYIGGTLGIPFWMRVSKRVGKHRTMAVAKLLQVLVLPVFIFLPTGDGISLTVFMACYGVLVSSGTFLLRAITADVVDLDYLESGEERTAFFYSLLTMTSKAGMALAVGGAFMLLDVVGFKPGQVNTPQAIDGLRYLFVGIPMCAYLAIVIVMWNFPLGRERQQSVRAQIESKYATAGAPAGPA